MLGSAVLRVPEFVAPKAGQRPENEQILRSRPIGPPERGDHLSTTGPVIKRYLVEEVLRGLHGLGLDATTLATRFGLIAARNATAYDNIPLMSYLRFFDEAAVRFDHPTLGLEIGSRFRAEQLGPIYPLLLTSETLREALSTLSQFQETLQSETTLQFDPHAPQERFVYHLAGAASGSLRQDVEYVLSSICALVRELIGQDWRPVEVLLALMPGNISPVWGRISAVRCAGGRRSMRSPSQPPIWIGRSAARGRRGISRGLFSRRISSIFCDLRRRGTAPFPNRWRGRSRSGSGCRISAWRRWRAPLICRRAAFGGVWPRRKPPMARCCSKNDGRKPSGFWPRMCRWRGRHRRLDMAVRRRLPGRFRRGQASPPGRCAVSQPKFAIPNARTQWAETTLRRRVDRVKPILSGAARSAGSMPRFAGIRVSIMQ